MKKDNVVDWKDDVIDWKYLRSMPPEKRIRVIDNCLDILRKEKEKRLKAR